MTINVITPGPFAAPEGSTPKTYKVTVTTVFPMVNTDPSHWDIEALLEEIRSHYYAEVEAVELIEGGRACMSTI